MRGGVWSVLLVTALAVAGAADPASACWKCSDYNTCGSAPGGGKFCVGDGLACSQIYPCSGGGRSYFDARRIVTVFVTLHEDDARDRPLVGANGGRRVRAAGPPESLDETRRLAGEALSQPGSGQHVLGGRFIVGEGGFRVGFRSPRGDGWAVHADPGANGVQVSLRERDRTRFSRVVARETLGENDALVARVRLEGRSYLAVVRAHVLTAEGEAANGELAALQRPFYVALRGLEGSPDARWEVEAEE